MILIRCDDSDDRTRCLSAKSECGASLANATQVRVWRVSRYWSLPISRHASQSVARLSLLVSPYLTPRNVRVWLVEQEESTARKVEETD
jgi:hypothetical protein